MVRITIKKSKDSTGKPIYIVSKDGKTVFMARTKVQALKDVAAIKRHSKR